MASNVFRCPACQKQVKERGLMVHLRRSQDARCQSFFSNLGKGDGDGSESLDSIESDLGSDESDAEGLAPRAIFGPAAAYSSDGENDGFREPIVVEPQGDFFGNYGDLGPGDIAMNVDEPEDSDSQGEGDIEMDEAFGDWLDGYDGDQDSDLDGDEEAFHMEPDRANLVGAVVPDVEADADENPDRVEIEKNLRARPFVVPFGGSAGSPIVGAAEKGVTNAHYGLSLNGDRPEITNIYAPFTSHIDWEIACWAKLQGLSSTAFTELMAIDGVVEALGLSYKSSAGINDIIDDHIPASRPSFRRHEVMLGNEVFEVYFRDIIPCIKALFTDQEFTPYLVFVPEKHYVSDKKDVRMFHDMHTGCWWWTTQEALEKEAPGCTIIPIILSSDKTQVTLFCNKSAYPLYLTIGNILKEVRRKPSCRAYILLAYLPTTKLTHKLNLSRIPMAAGNGTVYLTQSLFAIFIGDYTEQILTGGVKNMHCATCPTDKNHLGDFPSAASEEYRDLIAILDALDKFDNDPAHFFSACKGAGIKPLIDPFWKGLPFAHIYRLITPDILHQLYQGVIKHLLKWLIVAYGEAEIDAHCCCLPPNHNIRLFMNGITSLSRVSGAEHDQMCCFMLGLIIDIPLENGTRTDANWIVRATQAILDFLYLSQYPVHNDEMLECLDAALKAFHDNKQVFIDLGIRDEFNIPKLHFMYTERLHIDLAKDAYHATNRKDEYPQMTLWLEQREKINQHEKYISWVSAGCPVPKKREPSASVPFNNLITDYGAHFFHAALARFVVMANNPMILHADLDAAVLGLHIPFAKVPVWHQIKYLQQDPVTGVTSTANSIHIQPSRRNNRGKKVPGRFDTALIHDGREEERDVAAYRIGQVRVVFSIPKAALASLFPNPQYMAPTHLAYIEWFTPFTAQPSAHHLIVIPLANIQRSAHLLPKFGPIAPAEWSSSNVLDKCPNFFVNSFSDQHFYC
ncbi:hypothetical protein C8J56DRAFT_1001694 [Mycena floridula]|nr:hypothetical protein C8J56DRAFT_1001694 [Mycena floridula]